MFEIIKLLFDICLFKRGPQDVPFSLWLLRTMVIVDISVSFLMASIQGDWFASLLQAIVSAVLVIGFSWFMVYLSQKRERFYQTSTAFLGTDALISFIALPGMASMMLGSVAQLAFIVIIALMIWHWAVTGHIIRNALGQTWAFSLGLAFLYLLGSYQVMVFLTLP
jgi:hypothetical protein